MQTITMTQKELVRYETIKDLIKKRIKEKQASLQLRLSVRQVRRLKTAVMKEGPAGIVHKNRGKKSNRKVGDEIKDIVLKHIKKEYLDFGPTLAMEKLNERNSIKLSIPTIRRIMIEGGIWQPKKNKAEYRSLRDRRECQGELVQFDGSYHDWFENGEKHCLLNSIDDATGMIEARFAPNEGCIPVLDFWKRYFLRYGKPTSIYVDRFNTYKVNIKTALDNLSQFEQAMEALGIEVIHARSPQAKGRIERSFGTLQDRLVKEMRLEGIKNPQVANKFLQEVFLPKFNGRFNVVPKNDNVLHRELNRLERKNLDQILAVKNRRCVNNDFTVRFRNQWFQLSSGQSITVRAKDDIIIEERTDGKIYLRKDDEYLKYEALTERPPKMITQFRKEGIKLSTISVKKYHRRSPYWTKAPEPEPLISYAY